jgi:FkbM family methyltransferase
VTVTNDFTVRCHPLARKEFKVFETDPDQTAELEGFIAHCADGMHFADIGAHYGFFTLAALHYGGPNTTTLSVDASPRAIQVLRQNLVVNQVSPSRFSVRNVAVAGCDGTIPMLTTGPFSADYLTPASHGRSDGKVITACTLDSLLSTWPRKPSHLKLDIEGCEYEVVHASIALLERLRPVLFLELHGSMIRARGGDPARVVADLRECGYRQFEVCSKHADESSMAALGFNCRIICAA